MNNSTQDKMFYEKMKQTLISASDSYYNKSESILTDEEFDILKAEFKSLFPNDPLNTTIGAPVDNSHWEKAEHDILMTSLNKCNEVSEFLKWVNITKVDELVITTKLDGISLNLKYVNGKLEQAITRGDGIYGEVITRNVIKMKNVKKSIGNFTGNLRGEIVLKQKDFESLNKKLSNSGEKLMSNPRNAANGIAKRLDSTDSEYLTVLYYFTTGDFKTEAEKFKYIENLGLETAYWKLVNIDGAVKVYKEFEDHKRAESEVDIDGMVISVNNLEIQKKLGLINDNPKYSIAWKFKAMFAKTKLIDISWQPGNQQILTPVAIFETVRLGADISRASLCNVDMFITMNLAKGDEILVSRRNDVIPKVESIIKKSGNKPFEYPKTCTACGELTTIKGKFLYCLNEDCDSNVIGSLNKFIDKTDMLGISESTLTKLYNSGKVNTPADLYKLTKEDVLSLDGFAERSAQKVIDIINEKKEMNLPVFIGSLNIPQFSESMAKLLVESGYDTLDKMLKISKSELLSIKGIEDKKAMAFLNGINKKKELIKDLLKVGVVIKQKEKVMKKSGGKLIGKSFVFTGAINRENPETPGKHYNRETLQLFVIENGGTTPSSLSKEVNYLVQADKNSVSSKTQKAIKYGTNIISEEEFFTMLGM
jgi:DNA ligase (NAD+)